MNTKNTKLYFVALIPPREIYERTLAFKEEVAEKFGSKAALRSPPHITLHMPFQWKEDKEHKIVEILQSFITQQQSITIRHNGFGSFPPRVIFIHVEKIEPLGKLRSGLIREMRRSLNLDNADYKDQAFHPHMTIAFRDLKKNNFAEAWVYYKDQVFEAEWICEQVSLLKHNGKSWDVFQQFNFR